MTFLQRVGNVVATGGFHYLMACIMPSAAYNVIHSYIPDAKLGHSRDVERNASLILVNSHFSFGGSKPTLPHVVDVGGMHCKQAQKLPEEFSKFVDEAGDNGFIVFSLGSVVQAKFMPENVIESFKAAFKQISPVRVIWKYEETLEGLSSNVMISKWIPQQDLIGHPKCRLAITHGGLLSLQEVMYHGVPVFGVPMGMDRDNNLALAIQIGIAKTIEREKLTPELAFQTIQTMLQDKSFKQNAEKFSKLMRDRPQSPLETATYWVEYILRHEGALHLKSSADKLNFVQYFLIDVFAFIFTLLLGILYICFYLCRMCYRKLFSKSNNKNKTE